MDLFRTIMFFIYLFIYLFILAALKAPIFNSELIFRILFHVTGTVTFPCLPELYPQLVYYCLLLPYLSLTMALLHLLCSTCVTYGTPCHTSGYQMPPKPFPRKAEGIPKYMGGKYPKDVPPLTYSPYKQSTNMQSIVLD